MATGSLQALKSQIEDLHFNASISEHIRAANRGVEVTRIYLFKNRDFLESDEIKSHLVRADQEKMVVRILIRDKVSLRGELDFLIFADRKVSVGTLDIDSGLCNGARVMTDPDTVQKYINDYQTCLRVSFKVTDLIDPETLEVKTTF